MKAMSEDVQGWIIHLTFSNLIGLEILQRVQQSDHYLPSFKISNEEMYGMMISSSCGSICLLRWKWKSEWMTEWRNKGTNIWRTLLGYWSFRKRLIWMFKHQKICKCSYRYSPLWGISLNKFTNENLKWNCKNHCNTLSMTVNCLQIAFRMSITIQIQTGRNIKLSTRVGAL